MACPMNAPSQQLVLRSAPLGQIDHDLGLSLAVFELSMSSRLRYGSPRHAAASCSRAQKLIRL